jgi:hypothetical protein
MKVNTGVFFSTTETFGGSTGAAALFGGFSNEMTCGHEPFEVMPYDIGVKVEGFRQLRDGLHGVSPEVQVDGPTCGVAK